MARRFVHIAFDGERPNVKPGDLVECRTAFGKWVPMTAFSEPRYDDENVIGTRCYLTVAVGPYGDRKHVNWPAEDVRPATDGLRGDSSEPR